MIFFKMPDKLENRTLLAVSGSGLMLPRNFTAGWSFIFYSLKERWCIICSMILSVMFLIQSYVLWINGHVQISPYVCYIFQPLDLVAENTAPHMETGPSTACSLFKPPFYIIGFKTARCCASKQVYLRFMLLVISKEFQHLIFKCHRLVLTHRWQLFASQVQLATVYE